MTATNPGYLDDANLPFNVQRFQQYLKSVYKIDLTAQEFCQGYADFVAPISLRRITEFPIEFFKVLDKYFDFGRTNTREPMARKVYEFLKKYPEFYHDNPKVILRKIIEATQTPSPITGFIYSKINRNPAYGGALRQKTKEVDEEGPVPFTVVDPAENDWIE